MISHFEDAIADAQACPRMWSVHDADDGRLVGFVMISDDIPQEVLDADDDIVGPYFLWRLLIDRRVPGPRLRPGDDRRGRRLRPARPGADVLYTSCEAGEGSPQPFYLATGSR